MDRPTRRTLAASFFLTLGGLFVLYFAFLNHGALYPGSGNVFGSVLVVFAAYVGLLALHEAMHIRRDAKRDDGVEL